MGLPPGGGRGARRILLGARHQLQQHPDHGAPHLLDGLPHGGQRRVHVPCHGRVVEPDQGHVLGNVPPGFAQRQPRSGGHHVRGAEDRVHLRVAGQQFPHGTVPTLLREVALRDQGAVRAAVAVRHVRRRGALPSGRAERRVVAGQPAAGPVDVRRPGDGGDLPPSAADQVLDGELGAEEVVGVHVGQLLGMGAAAAEHRGHADFPQLVGQRIVAVHGHQQDAVHPVRRRVLGEALASALVADEGEQELHVRVPEFGADPAQDLGEVGLGEQAVLLLRDDERDGVHASGRQCPRGTVGDVAQFRHGGLDRAAGAFADPGGAVDDPGGGSPPHARTRGDLFQGRPGFPGAVRAGCWHGRVLLVPGPCGCPFHHLPGGRRAAPCDGLPPVGAGPTCRAHSTTSARSRAPGALPCHIP